MSPSRRLSPLTACALLPVLLWACRTAPPRELGPKEAIQQVTRRTDSLEALEIALEAIELSAMELPWLQGWTDGPSWPAYWQAAALAWNIDVARALREALATRAEASSAGAPDPILFRGEAVDLERIDQRSQVNATLDVLGILGLGPAAAARELADTGARSAIARLEAAIWSTRHTVDRALLRLTAERARVEAHQTLLLDVAADKRRITLLSEDGWLAPHRVAMAEAMIRRAERAVPLSRSRLASLEEDLARASGLPSPGAPFEDVPAPSATTVSESADEHPALRARRFELAVSEAALRLELRRQWPSLRIGPRWQLGEDLLGALVQVDLPWPGSLDGFIQAAVERRELAAEEYLEETRRLGAARERARLQVLEAELELEAAEQLEARSADAWRGARALFSVETEALGNWIDALERRLAALTAVIDADERRRLAVLALREATGNEERP
ncbi:MAG: TolC family protein [Planctomycetota bacterium]